jgi:Na+-transporting methylmalonyl-CoA/oxaloacetate decarboxylase gamma subunit
MNVFMQAALLTGYGLAVVFAALLIFCGLTVLLNKLFPGKKEEKE